MVDGHYYGKGYNDDQSPKAKLARVREDYAKGVISMRDYERLADRALAEERRITANEVTSPK